MLSNAIPCCFTKECKSNNCIQALRSLVRLSFVMLFVIQTGCQNRRPDIRGMVVTKDDIVGSGISPVVNTDSRYAPVQGATIYLSLGELRRHTITNTVTSSDEKGRYTIPTGNLPPPTDEGGYYLIVEKEGYEPFTCRIRVGQFAHYNENTIFLKPNP